MGELISAPEPPSSEEAHRPDMHVETKQDDQSLPMPTPPGQVPTPPGHHEPCPPGQVPTPTASHQAANGFGVNVVASSKEPGQVDTSSSFLNAEIVSAAKP